MSSNTCATSCHHRETHRGASTPPHHPSCSLSLSLLQLLPPSYTFFTISKHTQAHARTHTPSFLLSFYSAPSGPLGSESEKGRCFGRYERNGTWDNSCCVCLPSHLHQQRVKLSGPCTSMLRNAGGLTFRPRCALPCIRMNRP